MVATCGDLLLVDNSDDDRNLAARRLRRAGYNVIEAGGGLAALDLIKQRSFDLILLDIDMPDLNGLDVLTRVRSQYSPTALPVIMFTVHSETAMIVEALERGANDYVTKPVNFPIALARIQAQISYKQAQAALCKAKEAAELANRAKSTFLASMSHELRTPLNAIIGFSEVIAAAHMGPINAKYREYAGDIHDAGHHLLKVINDLLDLSKIDSGQLELHLEPTSLTALIQSCAPLVAGCARKGEVTLLTELPENLPLIYVDQIRMKQILLNLMHNAVKFTSAGGSVSVTAEVTCSQVTLRVSDTGIGIRPEDIPRIVQPFRQADSNVSRANEGTGLGLAITKRLAEAHGGNLIIESQLGVGTVVTVRLPADRLMHDAAA